MNFKEIEDLLEKFYEGTSTPSEERKLREFFSGSEIPPHLSSHADLFRYYEEAAREELPDPEFEDKFLASIDKTRTIPLISTRKRVMYITGIAATLILLAGLVFTFRNDVFLRPTKITTEQELAYRQVKKALSMVSANLNAGLVHVRKLDNFQEGLNKASNLQVFQKGVDQMKKISKFYQYQKIVINPGDQPRP